MTGVLVELTEEDAVLFREFRRVQDTLHVLIKAGVFDVHGGQAHINFNDDGVITKVQILTNTWKRGNPQPIK